MRHRTLCVTCVGAAVFVLAAVLVGQQTSLGYDDTPLQPNRRWHIHDGARPQPRVVGLETQHPVGIYMNGLGLMRRLLEHRWGIIKRS